MSNLSNMRNFTSLGNSPPGHDIINSYKQSADSESNLN